VRQLEIKELNIIDARCNHEGNKECSSVRRTVKVTDLGME